MSFDVLPNELLTKILKRSFSKISLQNRIKYRVVSSRWCAVIEDICHETTSLKLFGSQEAFTYLYKANLTQHDPSDLDYWKLNGVDHLLLNKKHFNESVCDLLARLFPNVQHLIVCVVGIVIWANLPYFLNKCTNLKSLSLTGNVYPFSSNNYDSDSSEEDGDGDEYSDKDASTDEDAATDDDAATDENDDVVLENSVSNVKYSMTQILLNLVRSINGMTALKRIDFLMENFEDKEILLANEIAQILPNLERLALSREYGIHWCRAAYGEVIRLLGPSCTHLKLSIDNFYDKQFRESFTANPHLPLSLKYLYLSGYNSKFEKGAATFDHLTSLECIAIQAQRSGCDLLHLNNKMLQRMSKLPNLAELRLLGHGFGFHYVSTDLQMPELGDTPLRSLKRFFWFNFACYRSFDGELFCETLSAWFPNLEELYIDKSSIKNIRKHLGLFRHLVKPRKEQSPKQELEPKSK